MGIGKRVFHERWLGVTPLRYRTVQLTSAEILALNTTQKVLVEAPGANKVLEFVSMVSFLDYGTATYATYGELTVKLYTTAVSAAIAAGDLIQAAADAYNVTQVLSADVVLLANKALNLTCGTGNPDTGNGILTCHVAYRVHDFA